MKENSIIRGGRGLGFILIMASILSASILFFDNTAPDAYALIWLLPLGFLVSFLFLFLTNNVGGPLYKVIVECVYFLRMVVTPSVMMTGGYASVIRMDIFKDSINVAISLMCFENIVVFVFLLYLSLKDKISKPRRWDNCRYKPTRKLIIGTLALVVFILFILRLDESVGKAMFLFLLDTDNSYYALSEVTSGLGSLSMYVELLSAVFKIVQIILPPLLLYYILKIHSRLLRIILSLFVLVLVCLYATEDRIDALLAGFAFLMTMRDSLGKKFRQRSILLIAAIGVVCFVGLAIKGGAFSSERVVSNSKTSSTIAAYFSGIPTVATGIDFVFEEGSFRIFQIIPDFISKIPFAAYVIDLLAGIKLVNSNQMFNNYISSNLGYGLGQILPTSVVGCRYFGYVFAPLFPCLLIVFARNLCRKTGQQNNLILRNLYYWITISVSLCPVVMSGLLIVGKLSWFYISLIFVKTLNR